MTLKICASHHVNTMRDVRKFSGSYNLCPQGVSNRSRTWMRQVGTQGLASTQVAPESVSLNFVLCAPDLPHPSPRPGVHFLGGNKKPEA